VEAAFFCSIAMRVAWGSAAPGVLVGEVVPVEDGVEVGDGAAEVVLGEGAIDVDEGRLSKGVVDGRGGGGVGGKGG